MELCNKLFQQDNADGGIKVFLNNNFSGGDVWICRPNEIREKMHINIRFINDIDQILVTVNYLLRNVRNIPFKMKTVINDDSMNNYKASNIEGQLKHK